MDLKVIIIILSSLGGAIIVILTNLATVLDKVNSIVSSLKSLKNGVKYEDPDIILVKAEYQALTEEDEATANANVKGALSRQFFVPGTILIAIIILTMALLSTDIFFQGALNCLSGILVSLVHERLNNSVVKW